MRQLLAILICLTLTIPTGACASAGRTPVTATMQQPSVVDRTTMADYVQRLPMGSKVRVERTDGTTLRGTLMQTAGESIVVQKNTRIPEAPISIPLGELARVTPENGGGIGAGKAAAIGIASGVGAFFAILAIAFAVGGD
jgi:hypothetical protein